MGEVYKARDTRLQRDVAIKILPAAFAADPDRLHRFQQEARAIAILNHPHICHLYDIGPDYLVMEYIEGQQLCCPLPPMTRCASRCRSARRFRKRTASTFSTATEAGQHHGQRERRSEAARFGLAKFKDAEVDVTRGH